MNSQKVKRIFLLNNLKRSPRKYKISYLLKKEKDSNNKKIVKQTKPIAHKKKKLVKKLKYNSINSNSSDSIWELIQLKYLKKRELWE